jgi:hypothetical protein
MWEKYLEEKYGSSVRDIYRQKIEELEGIEAKWVVASRIYNDELFIQGVRGVSVATGIFAPVLLREYGQYFLNNKWIDQHCAYLLERAKSARDLLMQMNGSRAQTPLFPFGAYSDDYSRLLLRYDHHRLLCPLMRGMVEGAATHFGEHAVIAERECMTHGAPSCLMDIKFERNTEGLDLNVVAVLNKSNELADTVLTMLSQREGYTLAEVESLLHAHHSVPQGQARLNKAYTAISQLQHAGLVRSSEEPSLETRKYWRV